jgi:hypothetical protein
MKNVLKFGLRATRLKVRNLIKLLINLINPIKGLIGELISFET